MVRLASSQGRVTAALVLGAVLLLGNGCASSGKAVRAAEQGKFKELSGMLDPAKRSDPISGRSLRRIAYATANYEVSHADEQGALTRIGELQMCADEASGILKDRMEKRDEAGAKAGFVLLEREVVGWGTWSGRLEAQDPAWQALGAFSLTGKGDDGNRRRKFFTHFDARLRKAALLAATRAKDPADATELLEVVRLDPDGVARSLAARTLGALGGREVVTRLRDRWARASEPLKSSIVSAWGGRGAYGTGGLEQLLWVAETQHGAPAAVAAKQLLIKGGEPAQSGNVVIAHAIEHGGQATQLLAINLAMLNFEDQRVALEKAAKSSDLDVRVAALSKLSYSDKYKQKAVEELAGIAATEKGGAARRARSALAMHGDRRVVLLLVKDLQSKHPNARAWAAGYLARMGEWPHVAPALADSDASVRNRAACAVLGAPSRLVASTG